LDKASPTFISHTQDEFLQSLEQALNEVGNEQVSINLFQTILAPPPKIIGSRRGYI
jgi:hypothetical protein